MVLRVGLKTRRQKTLRAKVSWSKEPEATVVGFLGFAW